MGVRTVRHIGQNIIGKFPSLKMGRMISFESTIERDYLHLLEYEASVRQFAEQPLTIAYIVNGKMHHYTPDFKVETTQDITLIDCKPQAQVVEPSNQLKFKAATAWCAEKGWLFKVVTDAELREGCYLSNVKTLFRHAHRKVTRDILRQCEHVLSSAPCTPRELAQRINADEAAAVEADVLCLAFHHALFLDIENGPLTAASLVYQPGNQP